MSIDAHPSHGEKVRKDLNILGESRRGRALLPPGTTPLCRTRVCPSPRALIELAITSDFFLQCNPKICYTNTYANT